MTLTFFLSGPLNIISSFFQAIGDARRAALLGLPRLCLFAAADLPDASRLRGMGIWYAGAVAGVMMLGLTAIVLLHNHRRHGVLLGLFHSRAGVVGVTG